MATSLAEDVARRVGDVSQEEIGNRLGVSQETISRFFLHGTIGIRLAKAIAREWPDLTVQCALALMSGDGVGHGRRAETEQPYASVS